jgi:hypothetical protein
MNREQRIRELQTCGRLVEVIQFHPESAPLSPFVANVARIDKRAAVTSTTVC